MKADEYTIYLNDLRKSELAKRSVSAAIGQMALLLATVLIGLSFTNHYWLKVVIVFSLSAVCLMRLALGKEKYSKSSDKNWLHYLNINIFLNAALWSTLIILIQMQKDENIYYVTIAYFVLAGLSSAASFSLSISKKSFLLFQITTLFPATLYSYTIDTQFKFSFPTIVFIFFIFLYRQREVFEKEWTKIVDGQFSLQKVIDSLPGGLCLINDGRIKIHNKKIDQLIKPELDRKSASVFSDDMFLSQFTFFINRFEKSNVNLETKEISLLIDGESSQQRRMHILILQKVSKNEIVLFFMDIEEQKEAQKELTRQREKLESSSKMAALGEMSSTIAHEINNPLAIISLKAQQIIMEISKISNIEKNDFIINSLLSIQSTVERISRIVKGLRSFSGDNENEEILKTTVRKILEDTLPFCETRLLSGNVKLKITNIDGLPTFECRAIQISQVFINILNNALDAVKNQQERWVHIDAQNLSNKIILTITDSGPGIPLSVREKLMTPFFTTKEQGHGTGLGLSLSKKIIDSHNGKIYFDHNSSNTKVVIHLPLDQSHLNIRRLAS
ncbi:MAG: sensor histidine kinase [Pseudobdellovibrionaceae bacterium]